MSELDALGFREFSDVEVEQLEQEFLAELVDPLDALGWEEMC